MVRGNAAADLRRWCAKADPGWLAGIEVVATDLAESFRARLSPHLDHDTRVADPFHVVRVGNRCVDKVRRRVQNETLGHRGRKHDPLCIGSASSCCPAWSGSTNAATNGCCSGCALVILTNLHAKRPAVIGQLGVRGIPAQLVDNPHPPRRGCRTRLRS